MSLSINTNNAAMAALQSLDQTTSALNQTENEVSTGKAVGSAADNPAVYSISQTMNAQIGALSGVQSGLQFAGQVVNTASQAATSISGILSSLSQTITAAETTGYDQDTMNSALQQAMSQINAAANGATFQGVNLLAGSTGNGVQFTSVSTAQDVNGNLYTQQGFNASATGLGLDGLNVGQSGVQVAFGTGNTLTSSLLSGSAIKINNLAQGTSAPGASTSGTAQNPAIAYDFIADKYTSTGAMTENSAVSTELNSAFATSPGLTVSATGVITGTGVSSTTLSNGSTVYSFSSGSVTVSSDASGNFTFSAASTFDANGNATSETQVTVANIKAGDNAGTDMISAMQNAGFGVTQVASGALTIAGNNIDAADAGASSSSVTLTGITTTGSGVAAPAVSEVSGSTVALSAVQAAISKMNTISSALGSSTNQVSQLSSSVSSLSNALTSGVGALTDADLAAESAKLTSLQTKQQLAIQSLSIANSQSSTLLSLFRGG